MSRDTSTGKVFEQIVLPALDHAGYQYQTQVHIGNKPNGSRQIADLVIYQAEYQILVSKKWQQSGGTAEEKIPFEVIMLARACREFNYQKAYLVLGGTDHDSTLGTKGWTLRKWYLSGGLDSWIRYHELVEIISSDLFISKINRRKI
ncbi:PD-(D/E)XK nuclease superfamily protein [Picosynechococcus sp. NKBG042902]|uniref:PD-(D/E)XK nuclease superfamily protein n=1 Tax=Picosynechococcus sp. NKBG042902 TaxID=490193 RepID=UPI0004ABAFBB|nr:PD-(D/E)XK nuclease superfamily protein [Picosynechococcus sp. NKBG042902]